MKLIIILFFAFFINFSYANTKIKLHKLKEENSITKKYHKAFENKAVWIDENFKVKSLAFKLLENIKKNKILEATKIDSIFRITEIQALLKKEKNLSEDELLVLDLLLIKAYDKYMNYLAKGFINWQEFLNYLKQIEENENIKAKWAKYETTKDFSILLKKAFKTNDIKAILEEVNYNFPYAKSLEKQLRRLQKLQQNGGYIKVQLNLKTLKLGDKNKNIRSLRQRLYQSNDLNTLSCTNKQALCHEVFDKKLFDAVLAFQKRHGLIADGVVGENTIKVLNKPIEQKIKTLKINLERMRWLPRQLGSKYILVNIPAYKLKFYEKEQIKLKMDIIVGKKSHPTAVFSHKLSEIIVNPYWKIPQTIVKNEIIPKLVEDKNYLAKEKIKVFENWDVNSLEYNVSYVDWSMYLNNDLIGTPSKAPMRFIQTPGGSNPLGQIKFLFPNEHSVYLHDTPQKQYFKMNEKTFSHGCIRLEKPFLLFQKIINNKNIVINNVENSFELTTKIPIHIVYLTAWVEDNKLHFRNDIYNYDEIHSKLLF